MESSFVTIVSGLPRSGTSLMMQALNTGGLPVLTDHMRKSDEDNPQGYFEFEPVKKTKTDPSWVADAEGKAVKMVYSLLYDLPNEYEYRVIFMRRHMHEVLASQRTMLKRSGRQGANIPEHKLADFFNKDLEKITQWVHCQDNFSMISIRYDDMVKSPLPACHQVHEFLGIDLNEDKMASVVNPSLYRNRQ